MIGGVVWKVWRWEGGLLAGYVFLIFAETLLIRNSFNGVHVQPELFWSWKAWGRQKGQILANVIMFIPIGMLVDVLWKWKGLLMAVGLSCTIELLQLISQRGLCEFDDVIHNALGALIGVCVVMLPLIIKVILVRLRKHKNSRLKTADMGSRGRVI